MEGGNKEEQELSRPARKRVEGAASWRAGLAPLEF